VWVFGRCLYVDPYPYPSTHVGSQTHDEHNYNSTVIYTEYKQSFQRNRRIGMKGKKETKMRKVTKVIKVTKETKVEKETKGTKETKVTKEKRYKRIQRH
jgi:hypothetical protein